jgi:hypothetical protein
MILCKDCGGFHEPNACPVLVVQGPLELVTCKKCGTSFTGYGCPGCHPPPMYPAHLGKGFAPAPSSTVLCEACGIHQRKRHERRCAVCNATRGGADFDGGPVTEETVGSERYRSNVIAQAAVMSGMRTGPFVRLLLDELEKTTERLVVAASIKQLFPFVITDAAGLTPGRVTMSRLGIPPEQLRSVLEQVRARLVQLDGMIERQRRYAETTHRTLPELHAVDALLALVKP